nr:hypothetical protein [Paracoccus sp. (in: a-proteobacteria)]
MLPVEGFDSTGARMFMAAPGLTPRQKAAVVVRLMLADGADLDLSALPPAAQSLLAQAMAEMDLVDRATCEAVLAEFCDQIDSLGAAFPGDL